MADPVAQEEGHPQNSETRIHLSDVEFRGETIYFIVLDRFHDGNKNNTGKRKDLNDPTCQDWGKYWGGDLQGVLDKLDYLQGLGITAIWLTPLFEQVEALTNGTAPVHGYWAQDFKRINERWVNDPSSVRVFERNDTVFDKLIAELHRRGMKFILDIVCNHSSPPTDTGKGRLYDDGKLIADFDNDAGNWYHHYGGVTNWEDEWQVQNCELCGLATFNENNVAYRRYIRNAIKMWLDKGVDALRVDTVKHMPLWFWQEFNSEMQSHKPDVFVFGEWIHSSPGIEASVEFANKSGMTILDFGLCNAIRSCLGQGNPEGWLAVHGVFEQDYKYRGANEMVTFFENHDMARLQSLGADADMLRMATALIMTSRGVPCLYYGSEQYLHNDTDGGNDPYNRPMMNSWDTTTEIYRITSILSAERAKNPAIQLGGQWQKYVTAEVYAFTRRYRDSHCFSLFNRGGPAKIDVKDTELPDGEHHCLISGRVIRIAEGNIIGLGLEGKDVLVLSYVGRPVTAKSVVRLQVNGVATDPGETVAVTGDCPELGEWDLELAVKLEFINQNMWFGELPFEASAGKPIAYKLVVLPAAPDGAPRRENRTSRRRSVALEGVQKWRDVWEE